MGPETRELAREKEGEWWHCGRHGRGAVAAMYPH